MEQEPLNTGYKDLTKPTANSDSRTSSTFLASNVGSSRSPHFDKGFKTTIEHRQIKMSKGPMSLTGQRVGKLYIAPMWQTRPGPASAVHLNSTVAALPPKLWHERMGHLNWDAIKVANHTDVPSLKGIKLTKDPLPHSSTCPGCQAGKAKRRPYKASETRSDRSVHPLERIHSDLVGPLPASIYGHRYAMSFTCDFTDHIWSQPPKSKDQTHSVPRSKHNMV